MRKSLLPLAALPLLLATCAAEPPPTAGGSVSERLSAGAALDITPVNSVALLRGQSAGGATARATLAVAGGRVNLILVDGRLHLGTLEATIADGALVPASAAMQLRDLQVTLLAPASAPASVAAGDRRLSADLTVELMLDCTVEREHTRGTPKHERLTVPLHVEVLRDADGRLSAGLTATSLHSFSRADGAEADADLLLAVRAVE